MERAEKVIRSLLEIAGVEVNGKSDADIRVKNKGFYKEVLQRGSLGLGESYMAGWWDAIKLDEFFHRVLSASLDEKARNWKLIPHILAAKLINAGRKSKAFEIGKKHYDIGNNLFRKMLDNRLVYSCGYWNNAVNLDDAQEAKLELICQKIDLKPGMNVLDIGCGWGSFCKYAAENYDVEAIGITVSKEQAELAREICDGLKIKILLEDYRALNADKLLGKGKQFDRIVSVGMFEHVGYKNYKTFMDTAHRLIDEKGLFLLHTIGGNVSRVTTDRWIHKYIFPNSMIPSIKQIGESIEGLFVMEDWHNFGADYDKTLMAWYQNFEKAWDSLKSSYDETFYRMWKYYLLSCAGSFRARSNQLWQIVLSKHGVPGGYLSIR
jgi:cyclopropane-fatty-acyl-phospholipid synthase